MPAKPEHDLARLPKWARSEIEVLRRNLADAKARLAVGPENSNTFADPYLDYDPSALRSGRPLGRDTMVRVYLDDADGMNYFDVRYDSDFGRLEVYSDDSIAVLPGASNSVYVVREVRNRSAQGRIRGA